MWICSINTASLLLFSSKVKTNLRSLTEQTKRCFVKSNIIKHLATIKNKVSNLFVLYKPSHKALHQSVQIYSLIHSSKYSCGSIYTPSQYSSGRHSPHTLPKHSRGNLFSNTFLKGLPNASLPIHTTLKQSFTHQNTP